MFDRIAQALTDKPAQQPERPHNPFPKGVVVAGSSVDVALRFFKRNPQRWFFHSEIVLALGRSKGEADYALRRLTDLGWLQVQQDYVAPSRSPAHRYKLQPKEGWPSDVRTVAGPLRKDEKHL